MAEAQDFKDGAFEGKVKDDMRIAKVFKILVGSPLTTPAEKEVFRHAVEWVEYLENRFGGL